MLKLKAEQLCEAIESLYGALEILDSVLKEIRSGAMRGMVISERLAEAWNKVNCCRVYTQGDINLEGLNLLAMGLIHDAKRMMDGIMRWKKGMTLGDRLFITSSICSASSKLLLVLGELENWLNTITREDRVINS